MTEVRARNSREIAVILGLVEPPAEHSLKAIEAGVRKYYEKYGRAPSEKSGDATSYIGYRATWLAVSLWLRSHEHGSLSKLCKKMGLKPLHAPHNLKAIEAGVRKYYKEHGKAPSAHVEDPSLKNATSYVGYQATWHTVGQWLTSHGHGSLSKFCKKMGFDPYYASHTIESIRSGVQRYYEEHGKVPTQKSGGATSYVGYKTTWGAVSQWLGKKEHGSLHQLCEEMGFDPYHAPHNLKDIKSGIQRFHKEQGKVPSQISGDATSYVGYPTTWSAVDQWVRNNGHGPLPKLCKEMGFDLYRAPHNLKGIKAGIQKFHKKHKKPPVEKSGDAAPYVGYRGTWGAVNSWLRNNGHGSLYKLSQEMGFDAYFAEHSLKGIKAGIRRYHEEHGESPSVALKDATEYVGYKTTWTAVSSWLRNNGHGSLLTLCQKMGFDTRYAPHSIEAIRVGIQKFHKEHGRVPSQESGDATSYVGYQTTWRTVDGWLRSNGHRSLPQFCKELGLGSLLASHSFKAIRAGTRKFYEKHGKGPTTISGDATEYVGYKTTWNAVSQWLTSKGHGSLSKLCKKLGPQVTRV